MLKGSVSQPVTCTDVRGELLASCFLASDALCVGRKSIAVQWTPITRTRSLSLYHLCVSSPFT